MSTFCLVHGSTQGPGGWGRLVPELEALGHRCICVDLPTDRPEWSASEYARVIAGSVDPGEEPVVVAHSASGLFLPLVPGYRKVAALVYLAAVVPQPGESFIAQYQRDPGMYQPGFVGKNPVADEALALEYMFHDCAPDVARWGLSTLRLMVAKQALAEVCALRALPAVPSVYISCRQDRTIHPDWWERAAKERLQVEPVRIDAGHFPHVSQAPRLARLLAA